MEQHIYIVTYDVADPKRWRRLWKVMRGYGQWVQLSVFQCRLSRRRHAELIAILDDIIHHQEDHVVMIDVGPADQADPRVVSLGKPFEPVPREPIIV